MSFYTLVSKSPTALIKYISSTLSTSKLGSENSILLFTLSTNAPTAAFVPLLESIARSAKRSIGCLSHPLAALSKDAIACSFAFFDQDTCTPFRSTIRGREEISVGRIRSRTTDDPNQYPSTINDMQGSTQVDWKGVWGRGMSHERLPKELQGLDSENVKAVVYLSANAHEGLSDLLADQMPHAMRLGLLASPTPFITGRPFTLFQNDSIYSDGAVGLAFTSEHASYSLTTTFPCLHCLTPPLKVTQSEGNLIISLANTNPTQLLLSALRKEGIQTIGIKDDDFYIGVSTGNRQPKKIYRVTSGDPSRGTLSLDSDYAPSEGTDICLYHRLTDGTSRDPPAPPSDTLNFLVSSPPASTGLNGCMTLNPDVTVLDASISASENGWVLGRGEAERAWRCTVGDGRASLDFDFSSNASSQ